MTLRAVGRTLLGEVRYGTSCVCSAHVDQQPECGQAAVRTRRPLRVYKTRIFSGHEIGGKNARDGVSGLGSIIRELSQGTLRIVEIMSSIKDRPYRSTGMALPEAPCAGPPDP